MGGTFPVQTFKPPFLMILPDDSGWTSKTIRPGEAVSLMDSPDAIPAALRMSRVKTIRFCLSGSMIAVMAQACHGNGTLANEIQSREKQPILLSGILAGAGDVTLIKT